MDQLNKLETESPVAVPSEPEKTDAKITMPDFLTVAPSPHIKSPEKTSTVMLDVVIALLPAFAWGVYVFGFRALLLAVISIAACIGFEAGTEFLLHRPITVSDLSAVVTGLLLVMNLPVTVPLWMPVVGAFFAIVIVKQLFGGIGKNFVNPALAARVFLFSWAAEMTNFSAVGSRVNSLAYTLGSADIVAGATPLAAMKTGALPNAAIRDMFFGNIGGCIGEVSAIALLIGGIYLIAKGVIRIRIPAAYILTVAVLTLIFSRSGSHFDIQWMLMEIFGGGLFLGAFFMATDYVTSPNTPVGEIIFGIGAGLLVVFIRYFGGYPEGVCYSILVMNILVWLIDKATMPKRFGVTPEMRKAEKEKAKAAKKAAKEGSEA